MKHRDQTYDLIKSLTKSEKRSFSLQSALTIGSKNYLKVFDMLDKQKEYDNVGLVKMAKKWKINLSYEKAYLQKQIIKMLRNVHYEGTNEMTVNQMIQDVDLLLKKKMYPLAGEYLMRAKKLAEAAELFPQLLNIYKWEHRLASRSGNRIYLEQYREFYLPKEKQYISAYDNLLEYSALQSDVFAIINKVGVVNDKEKTTKIKAIASHPLLSKESKAQSFIAKLYYYEIKGICFTQLNDYRKAYLNSLQMVKLFEKRPERIIINPQAYFASLSSLSMRCIILEKYEEAEECVEKMEGMLKTKGAKENQNLELEITIFVYERRMLISCFSSRFEKALSLSSNMEKFIAEHMKVLRKNFLAFHYLFSACAYFETAKFRDALANVRNLLNQQKEQVRVDYVISAHILYLALLFDMNDLDHLIHHLKSSKKMLETNASDFKCLDIITNCFSQLANGKRSTQNKKTVLSEAHKKLVVLYKVPAEKMILENFNIIKWMEAKMGAL